MVEEGIKVKLELYLVPNDKNGELIKDFLKTNKLTFKEVIKESENKVSYLKVRFSHSIHLISGFNIFALKQLLEHIKKYKLNPSK